MDNNVLIENRRSNLIIPPYQPRDGLDLSTNEWTTLLNITQFPTGQVVKIIIRVTSYLSARSQRRIQYSLYSPAQLRCGKSLPVAASSSWCLPFLGRKSLPLPRPPEPPRSAADLVTLNRSGIVVTALSSLRLPDSLLFKHWDENSSTFRFSQRIFLLCFSITTMSYYFFISSDHFHLIALCHPVKSNQNSQHKPQNRI